MDAARIGDDEAPDVAVLCFVLVSIAPSVQNEVREKSLGGKY
jgi:hypothetical protein